MSTVCIHNFEIAHVQHRICIEFYYVLRNPRVIMMMYDNYPALKGGWLQLALLGLGVLGVGQWLAQG